MFAKYFKLIRTIKYLKPSQVIYQIYYRIKPVKKLFSFQPTESNFLFFPLKFSLVNNSPAFVNEDLSFTFLNLTRQFKASPDWAYMEYGKLWNYNLQYFNYLHQSDISDDVKQHWLGDIGEWLRDGRLKLEPYPVSLRVINSIKYFSINNVQNRSLFDQAYAELNYLNDNLEFHILGNHLLENVFALFMGGHAFQKVDWQKKAKDVLYRELKEQILTDGGHFELSPMYHQIILCRVLELTDWYNKTDNPDTAFVSFIKERAMQMLSWMQLMTFKNGDIPHFNDSTNGIAIPSKVLLSMAGKLGLYGLSKVSLSESGYRKFGNEIYECVFDAGSISASYQPGHTHADIFSFVLYYNHLPFIVDAGTSTYEKNDRRDYERSTSAHNTVAIENEDQFEVWDGFRVGRRAKVTIVNESDISIMASHDGYDEKNNVIHERSMYSYPTSLKIIDVIQNSKEVRAKAYLHFHPDCNIEIKNGIVMVNDNATISFTNARSTNLEIYKFALGYNLYQDAKVLVTTFHGSLETLITFG